MLCKGCCLVFWIHRNGLAIGAPGPSKWRLWGGVPGTAAGVVCIALVAWLVALNTAPAAAGAVKEQTASLGGEVAAGDRHVTRLRNLPTGAKLDVALESDGSLAVGVVDSGGLTADSLDDDALFTGRTESRIEFSLTIPRTSTYYLVLDNRDGSTARLFSFDLRASVEADQTDQTDQTARLKEAVEELDKFEANLRQLLVFDDLEFRVGPCGQANAFTIDDVIVVCLELGTMILERVDDREQALNVVLFVMMHEIGHTLLRQWNFPSYDNEEVADELATVLLRMYGQGARVESAAGFFETFDPIAEMKNKRDRDSRHPLSEQRARNLQRWAKDPELVTRWQPFLVRHMQTAALRLLARNPKSWTDMAAVEQELAQR